ncbi:Predicted dehydrogenase [Paenibacillus sp. 1_12]|uniref:Gfo/Idh/MocA family protein n=1 Tax=Paenibacillus sp. 1_12 TaxID=1566278 RepID=UPI0008ED10BD|nr:Gfo/Idh/MocA family oxidoreductase [Paenibacillus sp. 1_12]SFK82695.1 Predicted dehydrogenase [Paenibacillus sp. 1_12]
MLKVAIIGAGAISPSHIKAYLEFSERCEIVAICDIYVDKAQSRIDQFQLTNAKAVSDYKELLGQDIDLISVCTPPYTHAPIAVDFLQAGKHVLVEKPMASSLQECDEMNEAARKSGKIFSVVAQNRFKTPMMKLKSVLDSGLMGPIVHAQVDSFWWRGHCYYDLWWRGTWEKEGGGCTLNHAVHHIDAFLWMMGRPSELQAFMSNTSHDNAEVEDLSIAMLRFPSGALAQITSSVVHHGEEQQLIFQGKQARVSAPWKLKASSSKANGFPEPNVQLEQEITKLYEELPEVAYEGHMGQIDNVLQAIETGAPLLIDGISGRSTLELILGIYKSASTGEKVTFPISADDPFYTREGIQANATHFYEKKASVENFQDQAITTGSSLKAGR